MREFQYIEKKSFSGCLKELKTLLYRIIHTFRLPENIIHSAIDIVFSID
ncbi:MAG: hypothetical protein IKZ88_04680 [Neisseriaceae bacterium]|nr:hypothetical protein [Neisseriaceae bacterium]